MVLRYETRTVGWLWWRWLLWEARGLRSAGHAAGRVAMQVIRWSFSSTNQYKGHCLYIFPSMMIPFDIATIIGCHASNCLHLSSSWSADGWRLWTHHHHHHRHYHPHHCQHHHHLHQPRPRLWWRFITNMIYDVWFGKENKFVILSGESGTKASKAGKPIKCNNERPLYWSRNRRLPWCVFVFVFSHLTPKQLSSCLGTHKLCALWMMIKISCRPDKRGGFAVAG